jgi:hypothetical protein
VVFHARIAAERNDATSFAIDDVADGIVAKLVRRHPHLFWIVTVSGADEVERSWDDIFILRITFRLTMPVVPGGIALSYRRAASITMSNYFSAQASISGLSSFFSLT